MVDPITVDAKVKLVGDRVTEGAVSPVPFSVIACGDPAALSAMERVAVRAPAAVGLNSTDTVQVAPMASEVPQVVVGFTNEEAFVPVMVSDVRVKAADPVFFTVTS